jgi:transketolase
MRNAFAKEITRLAQEDERIVLLSGDIGNRLFDEFKAKCPDRFYNCGVAEANMIGVAAGLALNGLRPVCYTIAPFITYRCMEQIRVDLGYHDVPVVIVGTGAGLAYASLGATHHSCEEVGMLRLIPDLIVLTPADAVEVRAALRTALRQPHPAYMRIGKKGEPVVHQTALDNFAIGRALPVRTGTDVALLASGVVLPLALETADLLATQGISAEVVSFPTVKPLDETTLRRVFSQFRVVATVEEHSVLGGFGGAVAEWATATLDHPRLLRFGTGDEFLHETCDQEDARARFGLTPAALSEKIRAALPVSP